MSILMSHFFQKGYELPVHTHKCNKMRNAIWQESNLLDVSKKEKKKTLLVKRQNADIKKDSENNNLILVNKNSEITESLLARLESMEIEMRKAKKLNLILSTVAIGILLLLSGLQIYFKL